MARHDARTRSPRRHPALVGVLVTLVVAAIVAWIVVATVVRPGAPVAAPPPGTGSATATRPVGTTPAVTPSATPSSSPSPIEDPDSIRAADGLLKASERRVGSGWFEISELSGRSCTRSGGRHGLQSERIDDGDAAGDPDAAVSSIRAYWRSLGLATSKRHVTDPTGDAVAVEGRGEPVESIVYTTSGTMTVTSRCTAPVTAG